MPNSTSLNSTTATWSAWFKTTQSASNYPFILGRASTSGSKNGISLFVDTSGHARVQVYGSSSPVVDVTNSAATVNDGNWHYLTFTINSSTASLYLDGSSQVVTATPSGAWSFNSQDARFGISLDSFWGKWAGSEDEGRVSNAVQFTLTLDSNGVQQSEQSFDLLRRRGGCYRRGIIEPRHYELVTPQLGRRRLSGHYH